MSDETAHRDEWGWQPESDQQRQEWEVAENKKLLQECIKKLSEKLAMSAKRKSWKSQKRRRRTTHGPTGYKEIA